MTERPPSIAIAALIFAVFALPILIGGFWLAGIGGSPFYCIFGGLLLATALTLFFRRWWAYRLFCLGSILATAWAVWEVGFSLWPIVPRINLVILLGLVLLWPVLRARGHASGGQSRFTDLAAVGVAILVPVVAFGTAAAITTSVDSKFSGEIADRGHADLRSVENASVNNLLSATDHYSDLSSINDQNVGQLEVAWTYTFGSDIPDGLEATPIQVGDSLYVCNSMNVIVSLDTASGNERWRFDPKVDRAKVPLGNCRGVAYYALPGAQGQCAERIYTNTVDARLIAVDARTGRRCRDFGANGEISLLTGMGDVPAGYYYVTSAPTVARGRIVLGGLVADGQYWGEPSGVIRAFDAANGDFAWAYDAGRPGRTGEPPEGESYTHSTPNSWAPMAYDDELGLVFVPTGNATPDYYGARRRSFDDEISSAVLALDVNDGSRRWVFQTVRHDVWDYDVASQPALVDLPGPTGPVKAILQPTKRGEIFVLDRATGQPIGGLDERKVSQKGAAPGERLSLTQPFPTALPSLSGGRLTEADMWGLTPFDQLWCRIKFRGARYEGQMTPPGLTPSIMYPGYLGGMNWGGVTIDPRRGVMTTVTNYVANYVRLVPRDEADTTGVKPFGSNMGPESLHAATQIAIQANVPYAASTTPFLSPLQVPCQQPPWSRLSAIDLRSREVLWSKPLGTGKDNGPLGMASHLPITIGAPAMGGTLMTAGNLTFVAASTDSTLRAFASSSGRLLWQAPLPASGNAHPMTYRAGNGRQFVVVAAGGHRLLKSKHGDQLIAYAVSKVGAD